MTSIDKRIGELMVRLRLSRRAATRRAHLEAGDRPVQTDEPGPPATGERRSDYRLVA
ncbi:hypothetical protein [Micromonospora aurantiaca (nom. illeg.)]|uniref:hypothetical protein n=1 Tax=Micromonospora aurantiaca (nom. illeg.) TaxID=47850 RepID=UPI00340DF4C3